MFFPQCTVNLNVELPLSLIFDKNFVKATILLKKLLNSWFHEIFFRWERISCFSTLCSSTFPQHSEEKPEILSHQKNISSNWLFSNFFSKNVNFTKFLSKLCETKSQQFPHALCGNFINCLPSCDFSVKPYAQKCLTKIAIFLYC